MPIGLKDLLSTRGIPTTAGSRILQGFRPIVDADVVEATAAAGLVSLGKLNMDEFAMGSSTEHSGYQLTRNPWDPTLVPGGSSGGRPRRWRPASRHGRSAPTRAARSGSRRRSAAWSA